jgi:dTDP-4-amino-4,6-dideoxygalactose transaminase
MGRPRVPLVDLQAQYRTIRPEVDRAISLTIEESSFILGPQVEAFEREFARFCEVELCVACGNGTDALSLALQALGIGAGDEVITVSHTFIATAEAITAVGARPVFVDVRNDTLLMNPELIEQAITPRTRAIVPVHLYGQMVDMDGVLEVARRHGLKVVEDAAQAHGARCKGRRAGSMGDAATFSFYPGKNLGAYGDAGAVVTDHPAVAEWIRKARNHGRATKYEHDFEARNSRMDGIQGAVLRVKLAHLEGWNQTRRRLAGRYDERLRALSHCSTVGVAPGQEPVHHLYVIRTPHRDALLAHLLGQGIEAGVHYPVPLHLQRAYAHLGVHRGRLPVTERAAGEVLSLPIYPELTDELQDEVVAAIRAFQPK